MPRIIVDTARCEAHGDCVIAAPEVFDLDDDNVVMLLRDDVPEDMRDKVERAARDCPVTAIRIED
jgi:ferredoxin